MSFRFWVGFSALFVLLISLSAATAFAQTVTGTISGTVKDSSGAVVPGAQVEVLNQDTGIARTVQSDTMGRYSALYLPLGSYSVTATAQGFQKEVRSGIALTVGREAVVDLAMSVGAMTQTVEVAGEAAAIDTTSATVSGLVAGEQIRDLPLNGRSYGDLALLNPGVLYNRFVSLNSPTDGFGVRMSVNGSRSNATLFLIDGTVANTATNTSGSVGELSLGVEGIREFRILTHNYSAEYGRTSGAVMSVVTRSGTNQFHGSAYEFFRNNILDTRDFFDGPSTSPYRRNQFGAAVGGPVKKDRIFFFGNYEGLRERLGMVVPGTTMASYVHQGFIPDTANPGQLKQVAISPVIAPYLALYPVPNGRTFPDGTGQYNLNYSQPSNEDYYLGRVDVRLSDKDNFYGRFIHDPSTRVRLSSSLGPWAGLDNAAPTYAILSETHIFSGNAINDFRTAFNRTVSLSALANDSNSSLTFVPGLPFGLISFTGVGGISRLGNIPANPLGNIQNLYQTSDTFSLVRGPHSLKFGFDLERSQLQTVSSRGARGEFQFNSLANFLAAAPFNLLGKVIGTLPNGGVSVNEFGWRRWLVGWFIQDDYRVSSRLTINLGLRHEFFTDPVEVNGLNAFLLSPLDSASSIGSPFHPAKLNFAPRVGLAWDPAGNGKTSVRVGAGVYYNQVDGADWYRATVPTRFAALYQVPPTTFPRLPANPSLSTGGTELFINNQLATPTVIHYGLDVQRQLTTTLSMRLGFIGSWGYNMTRIISVNQKITTFPNGIAVTAPRPNPNFGIMNELVADTDFNYNGLQASLQKALSSGFMFGASYTYSKALSEADTDAASVLDSTPNFSPIVNNPGHDYGRSAFDQRQTFVLNSLYQMPWDHRLKSGIEKALLGGWAVNGIWQYGSGLPLNINLAFNNSLTGDPDAGGDRPNLKPGFSNNPISGVTAGCQGIPAGQKLHTPDLWFDPCAFSLPTAGTFGNLGRNTVTGPAFDVVNFTLVKNTALTESMKLTFRAEFFNLFNHPSFGLPNNLLFNANGTHAGGEGVVTYTVSQGRIIQLGLKLTF